MEKLKNYEELRNEVEQIVALMSFVPESQREQLVELTLKRHQGSQHNDEGARFQAYSHLSRMHASTSSSFFTLTFAYLAYLGILLHSTVPQWWKVVLGMFPAVLPLFQMIKWYATNLAFREAGEKITMSTGESLNSFVYGRTGLYSASTLGECWLYLTQPQIDGKTNPLYWIAWMFFLFALGAFLGGFIGFLSN